MYVWHCFFLFFAFHNVLLCACIHVLLAYWPTQYSYLALSAYSVSCGNVQSVLVEEIRICSRDMRKPSCPTWWPSSILTLGIVSGTQWWKAIAVPTAGPFSSFCKIYSHISIMELRWIIAWRDVVTNILFKLDMHCCGSRSFFTCCDTLKTIRNYHIFSYGMFFLFSAYFTHIGYISFTLMPFLLRLRSGCLYSIIEKE